MSVRSAVNKRELRAKPHQNRAEAAENEAEWVRINRAVKQFGVGRTSLFRLIHEGSIKSSLLRKRGNVSGIRLISTDSLRQYIESFVESPNGNETLARQTTPGSSTEPNDDLTKQMEC